MRFMHWSYADLMTCPADYIPVILEVAREEAANARRRGQAGSRP